MTQPPAPQQRSQWPTTVLLLGILLFVYKILELHA